MKNFIIKLPAIILFGILYFLNPIVSILVYLSNLITKILGIGLSIFGIYTAYQAGTITMEYASIILCGLCLVGISFLVCFIKVFFDEITEKLFGYIFGYSVPY